MNRLVLESAIKALRLTEDTVLFVDIDQIPIDEFRASALLYGIPARTLMCGVKGVPNVEAMTRAELQTILNRKAEALRPGRPTGSASTGT